MSTNPGPDADRRDDLYQDQSPLPFVSVIVPTFNDPEGTDRCLAALDRQNYPHALYEVIVVDNGSTHPPRLEPKCHPFDCRLIVCHTPGAYAARNAGVREARGNVLAFTDADCVPSPSWIGEGTRMIRQSEDRCVIAGGDVWFEMPDRRTGAAMYQYVTGFQQEENIQNKGFTATANLFCDMQAFLRVGDFDERLFSGGDREWCWRASTKGLRIVFCPQAIVYTKPRASLAGAIRQARRVSAGRKVLQDHGMTYLGSRNLRPHRGAWASVVWILTNGELRPLDRLKVLVTAIVIKGAVMVERIRLRAGSAPERR